MTQKLAVAALMRPEAALRGTHAYAVARIEADDILLVAEFDRSHVLVCTLSSSFLVELSAAGGEVVRLGPHSVTEYWWEHPS